MSAYNSININELKENKFKFLIQSIPNTIYFVRKANLPGISSPAIEVPNRFNYINVGGKKVNYEDLTVEFAVQEDLKNYLEIFNWILSIAAPENEDQYLSFRPNNLKTSIKNESTMAYKDHDIYSDATLVTLKNSHNAEIAFSFTNIFPTALSGIDFNVATEENDVLFATATFKIQSFNLTRTAI